MQLRRFQDVQTFGDRVQAHLLQAEAANNLLFDLQQGLLHQPERFAAEPVLVALETATGAVVGAAIMTPPRPLVLSHMGDRLLLETLAQGLHAQGISLSGVGAIAADGPIFAAEWQRLTHQPATLAMGLRIHQLTQVQPIRPVSGQLRAVTPGDRPLATRWFRDFEMEAFGSLQEDPETNVQAQISRQRLFFWEDGGVPVSIISGDWTTPQGGHIGPVYTPPEFRRRGYATASVAALTQKLRDRGCHVCFLFTDVTNPTANHIYRLIGYQPVHDWNIHLFSAANAPDL